MSIGSLSTFVICLCDPVSDIKSPPKDAYEVLTYRFRMEYRAHRQTITHTISVEPPSNLYTYGS